MIKFMQVQMIKERNIFLERKGGVQRDCWKQSPLVEIGSCSGFSLAEWFEDSGSQPS